MEGSEKVERIDGFEDGTECGFNSPAVSGVVASPATGEIVGLESVSGNPK